jgi:hypothetical protein
MDLLGNIWYNIFNNKYAFKENTRLILCYTEVACPKCGGVGWVHSSFCFSDGTILVLE